MWGTPCTWNIYILSVLALHRRMLCTVPCNNSMEYWKIAEYYNYVAVITRSGYLLQAEFSSSGPLYSTSSATYTRPWWWILSRQTAVCLSMKTGSKTLGCSQNLYVNLMSFQNEIFWDGIRVLSSAHHGTLHLARSSDQRDFEHSEHFSISRLCYIWICRHFGGFHLHYI